jgi:hypothetical protein
MSYGRTPLVGTMVLAAVLLAGSADAQVTTCAVTGTYAVTVSLF